MQAMQGASCFASLGQFLSFPEYFTWKCQGDLKQILYNSKGPKHSMLSRSLSVMYETNSTSNRFSMKGGSGNKRTLLFGGVVNIFVIFESLWDNNHIWDHQPYLTTIFGMIN